MEDENVFIVFKIYSNDQLNTSNLSAKR
jgi:hypothetical protein